MTSPPAILHWSTETGWRGGERQVWLLARGLAAAGWRQIIAAPAGSPLAQRAMASGLSVIATPRRPLLRPWSLLPLRAWLRQQGGAVVHAHTSPALDAAAWLRRIAPVRAVVHTRRVSFPVRSSVKYRDRADAYVAISHAIAALLRAAGTPDQRLSVIPSAIDPETLAVEAAPSPFPGHTLVLCVAQMTAEKGLLDLARAWPQVLARQPDARLVLIGDGPEAPAIATAFQKVATTVLQAGWRDDVPRWLRAASLYVQPSLQEGLGSTAIEAALCGLPLVVTRTGGLPEVVDGGRSGRLVPPGSPEELATAIADLLADPAACARLGAAARDHAQQRFGLEALLTAHRDLYQRLVPSASGRAL